MCANGRFSDDPLLAVLGDSFCLNLPSIEGPSKTWKTEGIRMGSSAGTLPIITALEFLCCGEIRLNQSAVVLAEG